MQRSASSWNRTERLLPRAIRCWGMPGMSMRGRRAMADQRAWARLGRRREKGTDSKMYLTPFLTPFLGGQGLVFLDARGEVAQRRAQSFFHYGVVEGHFEHLRHRHSGLQRPGEQVADVLGVGAHHLGAEEASVRRIRVDAKAAPVAQHHARAALVLEGHF